ncbi:MAG: translation elongation factor 4 [bacterium]|nr:translation elongation factor 4 [bacterium]
MQNIRNFAIIAHIDHGKSTLADRMLEITHTVEMRRMQNQLLDSNPIERERGITIKLAPVRMEYQGYIFNLIDTPGHVDFSYEVSRSLAACEGTVLLVDATQGVQAQTLSHFHQAQKLGLAIIPVVNKIDVSSADVAGTKKQMHDILGFSSDSILEVSAKTGQGVAELLQEIIKQVPCPVSTLSTATRALVFNSNFDSHLGVVAWIKVVDGEIMAKDKLQLLITKSPAAAVEVGTFSPARKPASKLSAGEVGYIVTNLKDVAQLQVGDTLTKVPVSPNLVALPGYQPIKPVVFIGLYPTEGAEINLLRDALSKLKLSDSALSYAPEHSPALGNGFRVGLLGLLHADIVQERLEREFGLSLIASAPSVSYQITKTNGEVMFISKAADLPDISQVAQISEPMINLSIFVPETYVGTVMQLCQNYRATMLNMEYLNKLVHLTYRMPFAELIRSFYDQLKSASSGYATLDYEFTGHTPADLAKLDILVGGEKVDALSQIVPREKADGLGRSLVEKIKDIIPRQNFEIAIQAAIGGKILARADIKPFRKDVTAKLYGGDQTRKDKLLKKQKKGKARMKRVGQVDIPQEAFLSILQV